MAATNPEGAQTIKDSTRESTIYPGDERAHYFVRLAMTAADRERRIAQDALFAEGITDRSRLLSQANKVLSSVEEVQQQVTRALAVADRSMAQTPYLAEWIARDRGLAYSMASPR